MIIFKLPFAQSFLEDKGIDINIGIDLVRKIFLSQTCWNCIHYRLVAVHINNIDNNICQPSTTSNMVATPLHQTVILCKNLKTKGNIKYLYTKGSI